MPKLTAAIVAGTAPDAVRLKEYQVTDLAAVGNLLPLEDRVSQDSAVNLRDFTPQSVRGSHVRGQLVGVPDSHQVVVMFWNKNLLARAGLDPEAPPATWDALRDAAHRVRTKVEIRTVLLPWGFQFYEMSTREQALRLVHRVGLARRRRRVERGPHARHARPTGGPGCTRIPSSSPA